MGIAAAGDIYGRLDVDCQQSATGNLQATVRVAAARSQCRRPRALPLRDDAGTIALRCDDTTRM
jgi:hypothetical protein